MSTLCHGPSMLTSTPQLAHPFDDVRRLLGRRLERRAVADELDAEEEPEAAGVADERDAAPRARGHRRGSGRRASRRSPAGARPRSRPAPRCPTAADTGLPPKVLKYSIPLANAAAISGVVTTAASGCPLPAGLPIVTMSGTSALRLEPPELRADPAEADLHLVGDHEAARRAHRVGGSAQVALRAARPDRRSRSSTRRSSRRGRRPRRRDRATSATYACADLRPVPAVRAAVGIRHRAPRAPTAAHRARRGRRACTG